MTIRPGDPFIHKHALDPDWVPGKGQKYTRDAPKAECIVTRVTARTVYYRYQSGGHFQMSRKAFEDDYGPVGNEP